MCTATFGHPPLGVKPALGKQPTLGHRSARARRIDPFTIGRIVRADVGAAAARRLAMALRQGPRFLVLGTCVALVLAPAAGGAEEPGWRPAVARLAHERSLAQGCVSLLKAFAERDPMQRVQGQRIYARARADVDGLIALLKADLAGDRSPAAVPELAYRLESVPKQRQALCRHVDAAVGGAVRDRTEPSGAAESLAEGMVGNAIPLSDAAVRIWSAYRRAGDSERARIIAAIEGTRWRDYAEVSPGPP
jgi:hypothetical protein